MSNEYVCMHCGFTGNGHDYLKREDHGCPHCSVSALVRALIVPLSLYESVSATIAKLPTFADTGEAFVVGPDVAYVKYEGQVYKALSAWFWEEDGVWCYQLDAGRSARYWPPLSAYSTVEAALAAKESA